MSDVTTKIMNLLRRQGGPEPPIEAYRTHDMYYRAFVEQSADGVALVDARSGAILDANPALITRAGIPAERAIALRLADLFETDDASTEAGMLKALSRARDRSVLRWRERRAEGPSIDVEVHCRRIAFDSRPLVVLTAHDISVRSKVEASAMENQQRLDHLAHHDQLTGLPNRHYLSTYLPQAIEEARAAGSSLAILFIDLDHFKHVNDSRGHETGDRLLQEVGRRLSANAGPDDIVVRMGGDEFIVVMPSLAAPDQMQRTARGINRALDQPIVVDGHKLVTTASIGVSIYPRDGADMGELLKHSDSAMYRAKETGRNQFQLFRPEMIEKVKKRVALESALRSAVKRNQFEVFYQPIIDLRLHRVAGLEALVRWIHPKHGMITPDKFIDVAEDSGLIVPIGGFVLRHVMQDMATWRAAGLPLVPVSVNVSAAQLRQGDLANVISKLLVANGFGPELIELELTERAMFLATGTKKSDSHRDMIAELRASGVRIAIDDFGTGYSSLSYLKQWRVDKLKIDRSFVRDVVTDADDLAIVSAIFAIARQLRIEVVAEGIESHQQIQKLQPLGCRFGQGYLFSTPQAAENCVDLLRSASSTDDTTPDMLSPMIDDTGRLAMPALFKTG
jgi:diguanylate cyclase (GGDEF)-like protein/PAS domain S-box-containing protein